MCLSSFEEIGKQVDAEGQCVLVLELIVLTDIDKEINDEDHFLVGKCVALRHQLVDHTRVIILALYRDNFSDVRTVLLPFIEPVFVARLAFQVSLVLLDIE